MTAGPLNQVVGYVRVSTEEQGESGLGLAAQEAAIRAECTHRGWILLEPIRCDVASGKSRAQRPALAQAIRLIDDGAAGTLMVAKLDRLTRSILDFASIMEQAESGKWNIVALDLGVDLSTPAGELLATVMAAMARWERRVIGQRTRETLAALKAQGVTLGRPRGVGEEVADVIRQRRDRGQSYSAIARYLNDEGIPTGQGGTKWHPAVVRKVYIRKPAVGRSDTRPVLRKGTG